MGVKGIDHWVIVAGDLERTLDFYARLGFSIVWEHREGRPGRGMPTIRISASQKINVHGPDWPERPGYLGARRPTVSGADFCLEWEGTVQEVLDLLARDGIIVEAGPGTRTCARGPSTSVYFRDPDGNLVEFTVYPGEVRVTARLTNAFDEALVRRGMLAPEQVRAYEADALVDTGAVRTVVPEHVAVRLGLGLRGQRTARYADGRTAVVSVTEPLVVELHGRDTLEEALVLGDEVLIGQTVLEKLDLFVDCQGRRPIPNPAHPDEPITKV